MLPFQKKIIKIVYDKTVAFNRSIRYLHSYLIYFYYFKRKPMLLFRCCLNISFSQYVNKIILLLIDVEVLVKMIYYNKLIHK